VIAIDLCAGSGWAVACRELSITEFGVEIMPEARATRAAMGAYTDPTSMADLRDDYCAQGDLQIAGPPCQTFSPAGNGAGRRALPRVLEGVATVAAGRRFTLEPGEDERTALVLDPLRLALGGRPRFIVWEQVPPVLPVWEACAEVLRSAGYSVWTGVLNSEQYGVSQTRRRAFLIARRDGVQAAPPVPTHSRYHNRDPKRLDSGVLPWVSMAEALGWTEFSSMTSGQQWVEKGVVVRQERPGTSPAPTVTGNTGAWHMRSNYGTGGDPAVRGERSMNQPAPTVTSKIDRNRWTYVNGTHEKAGRRTADQPAPTVMFGARSNGVRWQPDGRRVTVAEAAALQTFPPGHPFQGSKGKQYLQIGNAVPPLLGVAVLRTFLV
jgi:DNA (cytosine-5)-methyltransferase 1